jgi:2-oxoglutarate dehydrogenase E1 component
MYQKIRSQPTTRTIYAEKLVADGVVTAEEADQMTEGYRVALEAGRHVALSLVKEPDKRLFVDWAPYLGHDWTTPADTRFPLPRLKALAEQLSKTLIDPAHRRFRS